MRRESIAGAIGVLATVLVTAATLQACDTPVYQYSMYEWRPDSYQVRYFHRPGDPSTADAAANKRLGRAGLANLKFASVEVAADGSVAAEHASAWRGHSPAELPLHVVTAPSHGPVFAGRLDADMAAQLVDSPRRRELAGELSAGRAGVLVVLIDRSTGDADRVLETARAAAAQSSDGNRRVGVVSLERNDPTERWLVRQLLAVESDLADIAGSMVFGCIGRGRVLPPFVGKGVTAQGMRDLIGFMHGPCACELKTANPGLDLLIDWDWVERLPQWAAGTASQPGFMLFDFKVDPDADGSGQVASVDPDAADAPVGEAPVVAAPQAPGGPRSAAEPRGAPVASAPPPTRVTAPEAALEPAPAPERVGRSEPTAIASDSHEPPAATPALEQPAAPTSESEPAPPAADAGTAPPVRLVARVPELPSTGQARLLNRAPIEESSFGGLLALRIGVTLVVLAALVGAGHFVLRRRRELADSGSAASDG